MELIDGKKVSAAIRQDLAQDVSELVSEGKTPGLAVIIVGDNPASRIYVNNKKKACEEVGIESYEYAMPAETTTDELLGVINFLNGDSAVNGILCQLPLPDHIDESAVLDAILPEKDVDGFHPVNCGRLFLGGQTLAPCTPSGIIEMLKFYDIPIEGKHAVIIGRSNIVGKPMAMLLLQQNATVTICHSRTENLSEITAQADILIAAVGKPHFVTEDMVKDDAIVIDVGMDRDENGKLCGDVDFDAVSKKASYITPVPGGVGPMTITMLLKNTITACREQ